jgi:hypothetical protein
MELLENIQYGVGYIVTTFLAGVTLDYIFPLYNEETPTENLIFSLSFMLYSVICLDCSE